MPMSSVDAPHDTVKVSAWVGRIGAVTDPGAAGGWSTKIGAVVNDISSLTLCCRRHRSS
jgi:hypothetical protein